MLTRVFEQHQAGRLQFWLFQPAYAAAAAAAADDGRSRLSLLGRLGKIDSPLQRQAAMRGASSGCVSGCVCGVLSTHGPCCDKCGDDMP